GSRLGLRLHGVRRGTLIARDGWVDRPTGLRILRHRRAGSAQQGWRRLGGAYNAGSNPSSNACARCNPLLHNVFYFRPALDSPVLHNISLQNGNFIATGTAGAAVLRITISCPLPMHAHTRFVIDRLSASAPWARPECPP